MTGNYVRIDGKPSYKCPSCNSESITIKQLTDGYKWCCSICGTRIPVDPPKITKLDSSNSFNGSTSTG